LLTFYQLAVIEHQVEQQVKQLKNLGDFHLKKANEGNNVLYSSVYIIILSNNNIVPTPTCLVTKYCCSLIRNKPDNSKQIAANEPKYFLIFQRFWSTLKITNHLAGGN
jgi:hypothetical protein